MTEETKPWRAVMPEIINANFPCQACDPREVWCAIIRANAELDELRAQLAERDARIAELEERLRGS